MAERYAVRADHTAAQDIDGEAVIINFDTYHYYGLNRTATAIWILLQHGGHTTTDLAARLALVFDVPADAVETDVRAIVGAMLAEGLVEATTTAAGASPSIARDGDYVAPGMERHGKLDQLMLSGE